MWKMEKSCFGTYYVFEHRILPDILVTVCKNDGEHFGQWMVQGLDGTFYYDGSIDIEYVKRQIIETLKQQVYQALKSL